MKRSLIIALSGAALAAVSYFGYPILFRKLQDTASKHVDVSTVKAAAIHIATSDPKTTLMVFEEDGEVSVVVTKMNPDGDYIDGKIWVPRGDSNLSLQLSQRRSGIVTTVKDSDSDVLPTRKSVKTKDGVRSYQRGDIEWIESPPIEKKPNQTPEPTAAAGRGSS